jgi:two-component system, NarL family, sensor histidine kinase BarA
MSVHEVIDWPLCLKRAAGKEELAKEMLVSIVAELPQHKRDLEQAQALNNIALIAEIAHKVNGICCYSGLPGLRQAAHDLESRIQLTDDSEDFRQFYSKLLENLERVQEVYSAHYAD